MTRGLHFIIALLTIAESDATAPKESATRTEYGGILIHFSLTDGQSGEELYVPSRRLATENEPAPDCSPLPPMLHLKFETVDGHMDEIDMHPKPEPCASDAVVTTASGEEYPLDCSDSSSQVYINLLASAEGRLLHAPHNTFLTPANKISGLISHLHLDSSSSAFGSN